MSKLYIINNWNKIYENNRTRELKNMSWFPLPIKLNGDGFTLMMEEKDGATIFGCFIILLEIASSCNPRGHLIRSNGEPHDSRSLVRLSRMNVRECDRCLQYCSSILKWLIIQEIENPAPIPHKGATTPQDGALQDSTDITLQDNTYRKFAHLKITIEDNKNLLELGYTQSQINDIYDSIENYKQNIKYKSLFLTTKKWLKKEYPSVINKKTFDVEAYKNKIRGE